jgi:rare lipoprotein A
MQRPKHKLKGPRAARLAVAALLLAGAPCAISPSVQAAAAQTSLQTQLSSGRIRYGEQVTLSGNAGSRWAGSEVEIEWQRADRGPFMPIEHVLTDSAGSFSARLRLRSSGEIRAALLRGGDQQSALAGSAAGGQAGDPTPSSPARLSVIARLRVRARSLAVLAGEAPAVRGRLLPARARRLVVLLGRRHGRWVRLAAARTTSRGKFALRLPGSLSGTTRLRVRFPGDPLNGRAWVSAGRVVVYEAAVASWYDDAGSTACGFHARYGVANVSLACGTRVAFRYGGRTIVATVDDRGPYVAGREWDLNQNTAAALGFAGVAGVWYSVR